MSRNVLNCRACHEPMVVTQASGSADFLAQVTRYDRHGPRGGCLWLRCCSCGAIRDWTPPR